MNKDSGERIAFYMPVSSEEQVERMTIGTQEEFLEQYRDLFGHQVAGIYTDEAISGTVPLYKRPEGGRLLDDAREGVFDGVLVYKLDRIGRTLLNVVDAHDRLGVCGVALRSTTEPIDTSSPSGRLIFHMLASFAEFERGTIRERTQHGLHRAFRNGKQTGRIPYGYDVAQDGGFVLVEEEAAVVREIFSNVAGDSTLSTGRHSGSTTSGCPDPAGSIAVGCANTRRGGPPPLSASSSTRAPMAGRTSCGSRVAEAA